MNNRPSGEAYFPSPSIKNVDKRVRENESLRDWFCRCVDAVGGLEHCVIEDHISVIGVVKWRDRAVEYMNIQALITKDGSLEDFYLGTEMPPPQYIRLELDLSKPGPLFKEPLPHIHVAPEGEPRMDFRKGEFPFPIVEFLEFIYLNYCYDAWIRWAKDVWTAREVFADGEDPFTRIVAAYAQGQRAVLTGACAVHIQRLKDMLAAEKQEVARGLWPLTVDAGLLSYGA
ncbi:MAG: hypothetical protein WCI03_15045 [bacterium]